MPSQQDSPPRLSDDLTSNDLASNDLTSNDLTSVIAQQEKIFIERQPESARMAHRAEHSLAGGVTSSWQITAPQPVWLSHGKGSKIYDVDGNEYVDLHGGYGAAWRATPTRPSWRRCTARSAWARTSPSPPRTRWRSARNWPGASACHCGGSPTRVPKPPWTPCT